MRVEDSLCSRDKRAANRSTSSSEDEAPLPPGWRHDFVNNADLAKSFHALKKRDHFFADAMRGHIRSLELRFEEAWKCFDLAFAKASRTKESIPNLVRQFLLNIYCFDNALIEGPLAAGSTNVPDLWIPDLPEALLKEYPEVKLVIQLRRQSEGVLRLHLGDDDTAAEIFESLAAENSARLSASGSGSPSALTMNYLGLAAASLNRGFDKEAHRHLDNAALSIQTGGELINRARAAAILHAFHAVLGEDSATEEWKRYLEHLSCPRRTILAFRKRAEIIRERCTEHKSLVLL